MALVLFSTRAAFRHFVRGRRWTKRLVLSGNEGIAYVKIVFGSKYGKVSGGLICCDEYDKVFSQGFDGGFEEGGE